MIEKDIPIPAEMKTSRGKYDWLKMDVGDSFAVDGVPLRTMQSACTHSGRRHGRRYMARLVVEQGVERVRVWRFA